MFSILWVFSPKPNKGKHHFLPYFPFSHVFLSPFFISSIHSNQTEPSWALDGVALLLFFILLYPIFPFVFLPSGIGFPLFVLEMEFGLWNLNGLNDLLNFLMGQLIFWVSILPGRDFWVLTRFYRFFRLQA